MKGHQPQVVAIIPARFKSTRLPGKPLLDLAGKPIIQHVYERALQARSVGGVIVATDDDRIMDAVLSFGGKAVMTSADHQTGTDRIAEAALSIDADIIVNVQGDEPFIEPSVIDAAVEPLLEDDALQMSTTCEPLARPEDLFNPNVVKVVTNEAGDALYFSRAPIPFPRDLNPDMQSTLLDLPAFIEKLGNATEIFSRCFKHTGLYVYRRKFLLEFTKRPRTPLEKIESLEQLRALETGSRIRVVAVDHRSLGVDTQADLSQARLILNAE